MSKPEPTPAPASIVIVRQAEELAKRQSFAVKVVTVTSPVTIAASLDNVTTGYTVTQDARQNAEGKSFLPGINVTASNTGEKTVEYGKWLIDNETKSFEKDDSLKPEIEARLKGLTIYEQVKALAKSNSIKDIESFAKDSDKFTIKTKNASFTIDLKGDIEKLAEAKDRAFVKLSPSSAKDIEAYSAALVELENSAPLQELKKTDEAYRKAYAFVITLSTNEKRVAGFAKASELLKQDSEPTGQESFAASEDLKKLAEKDSVFKIFYEIATKSLKGKKDKEIYESLQILISKFQNAEVNIAETAESSAPKLPEECIKFAELDENSDKQKTCEAVLGFLQNPSTLKDLNESVKEKITESSAELKTAIGAKFIEEFAAQNAQPVAKQNAATPEAEKDETKAKTNHDATIETAKAVGAIGAIAALSVTTGPIGAIILAGALMWWYSKKNADKREEREARKEQIGEEELARFQKQENNVGKEMKKHFNPNQMAAIEAQKDAMEEAMEEGELAKALAGGNDAAPKAATGQFGASLGANNAFEKKVGEELGKNRTGLRSTGVSPAAGNNQAGAAVDSAPPIAAAGGSSDVTHSSGKFASRRASVRKGGKQDSPTVEDRSSPGSR